MVRRTDALDSNRAEDRLERRQDCHAAFVPEWQRSNSPPSHQGGGQPTTMLSQLRCAKGEQDFGPVKLRDNSKTGPVVRARLPPHGTRNGYTCRSRGGSPSQFHGFPLKGKTCAVSTHRCFVVGCYNDSSRRKDAFTALDHEWGFQPGVSNDERAKSETITDVTAAPSSHLDRLLVPDNCPVVLKAPPLYISWQNQSNLA